MNKYRDKIIGYKFFNKEEEFKKWQYENVEYVITGISPFFNGMHGDLSDESNTKITPNDPIIFVTYYELTEIAGSC